jgi:hypothetical protein
MQNVPLLLPLSEEPSNALEALIVQNLLCLVPQNVAGLVTSEVGINVRHHF